MKKGGDKVKKKRVSPILKVAQVAQIALASLVVLLLLVTAPASVSAADYQDVTITATPSYIAIVCSPTAFTINSETGDSTIETSTTYYSNPLGDTTSPSSPVVDGECKFDITNSSSVNIDLTVDMEDFTGGDANMTNGETGTAGATSYGAYSYYSGLNPYTGKVIIKKNATGSDVLWTSSTPGANIKLGFEIGTQTTAWAGSGSSTSTLKITATKDV